MRYSIYLLFLCISLIFSSCFNKEPEITGREGKELPSFALLNSDSSTIDTKNIEAGKPFVIVLVGTSCPYSKKQIKEMAKDLTSDSKINLYAISNAPLPALKQFSKDLGLEGHPNIHVASDIHDFYGSYMQAVGVPLIGLYDDHKKLIKAYSGLTNNSLIFKTLLQ